MALVRVEKGGGVSIGANDRLLASFILMGGALFLGWKYYTKHGFLAANDTQRTKSPNASDSGGGGSIPILPQIPGTPGAPPFGPGTIVPQTPNPRYNPGLKPKDFDPGPALWPFKQSELNIDGGESILSRQVG